MKPVLRLALRSSPLSRQQHREWQALYPEWDMVPVLLDTPGDRDLGISLLHGNPPADFFTRDLDDAVRSGKADAALHSAKDLPWPLPKDMAVWALGPCLDKQDSLCTISGQNLDSLPHGARVGTSSPLRAQALRGYRPDLEIVSIRGTIQRRLDYLETGNEATRPLDGVIVARCALLRLGLDPGYALPFDTHPLQGHLAMTGLLSNRRLARAFAHYDVRIQWGRVSIAGAGPGRMDHVSWGVLERLKQADLVLYDALIQPGLLEACPGEKVFVGKRQGKHQMRQDDINQLMAESSRAGRRVVRLKAGDPLIFGRGSEEAAYLEERLIPHEILPGISAIQTAAACGGIPLTERERSRSIALVSGFPAEAFRWPATDTMAFYMAGKALPLIAEQALLHRQGDLPLAAIQGAGSPRQMVQLATMGTATELVQAEVDAEPVLYLGGSTIDERAGNGWFQREPRILYTGTHPGLSPRGHHCPMIQIVYRPYADFQPQEQALFMKPGHDWIMFTSQHTVEQWFTLLGHSGQDARSLAGTRIASIGTVTTRALEGHGIRPDLQAPRDQEHSQGLAAALAKLAPRGSILLPRSSAGLRLLPDLLTQSGYKVTELILYHTQQRSDDPGLDLEDYDIIEFSSPSTVEAFRVWYPSIPERILVHTRGPQTATRFADCYPTHPDTAQGIHP